ncbi:MAG: gfo/Idh/MocA family oxidoreductase, partial [Planctomycetes bacterium]|nr:gfo/Idh/MocA family oxidoreductase [Planctomycetota bacterium]
DVSAHARNFFDCVKTRQQPVCNPEVMRHSHTAAHAAAIAWILGRTLKFDPGKAEFLNDPEANSLRSRPARDPWPYA